MYQKKKEDGLLMRPGAQLILQKNFIATKIR